MSKNNKKLLFVFLLVTLMSALVWLINGQSFLGIDDANIYFIYMKNFAFGHGFVYNIGGERVEGFTSLLWTLIGSGFYLITKTPQLLLIIFNVLLISFTLWRLIIFVDNRYSVSNKISVESWFLLGLIAIYPGFFEWTVLSLMDTGIWCSLLILTVLNILRNNESIHQEADIKFNILIILLVFCRPESIFWCSIFIVLKLVKNISNGLSGKQMLANIYIPICLFLTSEIVLTLWRINYFGFPLPNTYYAKISASIIDNLKSGVWYDFKYFINYPAAIISVFLLFLSMYKSFKTDKLMSNKLMILFIFICATLLIPLITGGDHFNLSRFIQPSVPIIWLSLILSFHYFEFRIFKKTVVLFILAFLLFTGEAGWTKYAIDNKRFLKYEWEITQFGKEMEERTNKFFYGLKSLPTQGVGLAGASAYYYNGFTFDMLGLNNVEMAHSQKEKNDLSFGGHKAFNKSVFLKQHPDIFWMGATFIKKADIPGFRGLVVVDIIRKMFKDILFDKEFQSQYSNVLIQRKHEPDALAIFISNRFMSGLDTNTYKITRYPHIIKY